MPCFPRSNPPQQKKKPGWLARLLWRRVEMWLHHFTARLAPQVWLAGFVSEPNTF
jgi:hypothetical protein